MDITRRGFFFGAAAVAAGAALGNDEVDGNLTVFLSDIHISGVGVKGQPTYQNPLLDRAIDQILALRPRPRRAVVFGDIALWRGLAADYAESAPRLKRLSDAGIEVTVTTGNHDHRETLFAAYPDQAKKTPVPGRVTSVVDLGTADLLLLDSLNENAKGEGSNNAVAGTLDDGQAKWLKEWAASAKRPFFVGAHHPPEEVPVDGRNLLAKFETNRCFAGYIHGHNHRACRPRAGGARSASRCSARSPTAPSSRSRRATTSSSPSPSIPASGVRRSGTTSWRRSAAESACSATRLETRTGH